MKTKKTEKGFALLESVVFLMAFVILTAYTIDFFTIIHTGVVNSTSARTYLFETLQHRTNISTLRQENEDAKNNPKYDKTLDYSAMGYRFHGVNDEGQSAQDKVGAKTPGRTITQADAIGHDVNDLTTIDSQKNKTNVVFLKNGYGICLSARCP